MTSVIASVTSRVAIGASSSSPAIAVTPITSPVLASNTPRNADGTVLEVQGCRVASAPKVAASANVHQDVQMTLYSDTGLQWSLIRSFLHFLSPLLKLDEATAAPVAYEGVSITSAAYEQHPETQLTLRLL